MILTAKGLVAAKSSRLNLVDVIVLAALREQAFDIPAPVAAKAGWELAQETGLTIHQVDHAISKLAKAGAISRRQMVKKAGESATTELTALGLAILGEGTKVGVLPASMDADLRSGLIGQCDAFRLAVLEAWEAQGCLDPSAREAFEGTSAQFERIAARLRDRALNEAEAITSALSQTVREEALLEKGIVVFETADGPVEVDGSALRTKNHTAAGIDLAFVRDVLAKVNRARPGTVTRDRLGDLIVEVGYSRLVGFVQRHDAAAAERALVATMVRGWSRPRGMRDDFYSMAASALRMAAVSPQGGENCRA